STVMTRTAPRSAMATGVAAWVSDMRELPRGLGGFLLEHEGATHRGTRAAPGCLSWTSVAVKPLRRYPSASIRGRSTGWTNPIRGGAAARVITGGSTE